MAGAGGGRSTGELVLEVLNGLPKAKRRRFTPEVVVAIEENVADFTDDLVKAAAKEARHSDAEYVSLANVRDAANRLLSSRRRRRYVIANTIGGLLAGGGVSLVITMLISYFDGEKVSAGSALVTAVVLSVGLAGLAYALAHE